MTPFHISLRGWLSVTNKLPAYLIFADSTVI
jgi:hypothetical protein